MNSLKATTWHAVLVSMFFLTAGPQSGRQHASLTNMLQLHFDVWQYYMYYRLDKAVPLCAGLNCLYGLIKGSLADKRHATANLNNHTHTHFLLLGQLKDETYSLTFNCAGASKRDEKTQGVWLKPHVNITFVNHKFGFCHSFFYAQILLCFAVLQTH